ncbi:MAG: DNA starvation/stationary phase protection protein [Holosporaceae bacterium]|nr:DNA starvation/stationary phase protection protein [Holosporaceae bacterium]
MDNLVKSLEVVLADCYALYLKTQNYHWNVEGTRFKELHETFEKHYKDLAEAVDTVAELIRALNSKTIGTFSDFMKLTNIKDGNAKLSAEKMLDDLINDHIIMEKTLAKALKEAQKVGDEVVISFVADRLTVHRKNIWMMKSSR